MAQLLVRNLDEDLVRDLKRRAGEHGISVEEEHRRILREALRPQSEDRAPSFWDALTDMPDSGDDSIFERNRDLVTRKSPQELFGE